MCESRAEAEAEAAGGREEADSCLSLTCTLIDLISMDTPRRTAAAASIDAVYSKELNTRTLQLNSQREARM